MNMFLVQHVNDPTRGTNKIHVDLVLSSEQNMVENVCVGEPFSDHNS